MTVTKNNKKALAELYVIILNMSEELQEKIPITLKQNIVSNMDKFHYYDDKTEMMPETKALLSSIISEFLADDELKETFKEYDKFAIQKVNEYKAKQYSPNQNVYISNISSQDASNQKNGNISNFNDKKPNTALVRKNKNFFTKLIEKIKRVFKFNK